MKIPETLLMKFLSDNFEIKQTSTKEVRINSPFKEDRKFHVYIEPSKSVFTDYKNQDSGSMEKFIAQYLDIPMNQVIATLIKEYGLSFGEFDFSFVNNFILKKEVEECEIIKDFINNEKGLVFFNQEEEIGKYGKSVLEYLEKRRINNKYIPNMGYIYDQRSDYDKRLIIPFFEDGFLVYFIARDTTGKSFLRYKNPPKLDTKEFVLNIDDINDELVICEGALDALSFHEDQVATAMCSGDLGVKQIRKIINKTPRKIIYVPDQDETGMKKMNKNINELLYYYPPSLDLDIYIFNIPKPFKDFNEFKQNTGKDFILYNECELYNKNKIKPLELKKKTMDF